MGRYLLPSYFAVASIFALAVAEWRKKIGRAAWLLFIFLIASYGYANSDFISKIPSKEKVRGAHDSILELLHGRGIRGAMPIS